tara:strand:+ start:1077 stop:2192 length:1116 start_codon:yes stop_codon:yes gene_type:complete
MVLMTAYAAVFTLLAEIRSAFGFSEFSVGLIAGSAFIAGFIAQLSLSGLADHGYGKPLLILGILSSIVAIVWMMFAEDFWSWLLSRSLLGFGAGCARPGIRRYLLLNPDQAGKRLGSLAAWEMVGFLIGPIFSSILFSIGGLAAPFFVIALCLLFMLPFLWTLSIPQSYEPTKRVIRTLLKRKSIQACLFLGIAFYIAIGLFEAVWALFMHDLGASQLFIGITLSLFTLPCIVIAPWAGNFSQKRNTIRIVTVSLSIATVCMCFYGVIESIWWLCIPLVIHSVVDAVTIPAIQLAVGKASGEGALAAGQGLFGATGLVVAAAASLGGSYTYQIAGAFWLWMGSAVIMAGFIWLGVLLGRQYDWRFENPTLK